MDTDGRSIRIFIDTFAMMGNLSQAVEFKDVLGHMANTLCTLCCMHKYKNQTFPETNYSSDQHFGRLSLVRFDNRLKAVRACSLDKLVLHKL